MLLPARLNAYAYTHTGGLFDLSDYGGKYEHRIGCLERRQRHVATAGSVCHAGDRAQDGAQTRPAEPAGSLPDAPGETRRAPDDVQPSFVLIADTDWPAAGYHPPQPQPPDYDLPWQEYTMPVIEPVGLLVGQRVQVIGVGYGVVSGRWGEWVQVRMDLCGMIVGRKEAALRIA
jgi:hypothetical protein